MSHTNMLKLGLPILFWHRNPGAKMGLNTRVTVQVNFLMDSIKNTILTKEMPLITEWTMTNAVLNCGTLVQYQICSAM